jgi:hypothetical protein
VDFIVYRVIKPFGWHVVVNAVVNGVVNGVVNEVEPEVVNEVGVEPEVGV